MKAIIERKCAQLESHARPKPALLDIEHDSQPIETDGNQYATQTASPDFRPELRAIKSRWKKPAKRTPFDREKVAARLSRHHISMLINFLVKGRPINLTRPSTSAAADYIYSGFRNKTDRDHLKQVQEIRWT